MTPSFLRVRGLAASIALAGALSAGAGQAAAQQSPRDQLALAYLQLELALAAGPALGEADRAALNGAFDRTTMLFFAGNMDGALAVVDSMAGDVARRAALDPAELRGQAAARLEGLNTERRTHNVASMTVPYLLHVPTGKVPAGGWPVVVAVHGAGGDERMFFGGYGAGSIRDLADQHGVAVITPAAPLSADALFGLVDALAGEHRLDAGRVALLGHSMGAGVVAQATSHAPGRVRAVACIAGSCAAAAPAVTVPVFAVAGARDPLFRVAMLQEQAEALRMGGRNVEFRRFEAEGHTLVVGEALPSVMEWLAARLR